MWSVLAGKAFRRASGRATNASVCLFTLRWLTLICGVCAKPSGGTHHPRKMALTTAKPLPANPYNPHCWISGNPEIGAGTWIGAFTLIDGLGGLKIGKGCNISSGAQVLSHSTARRCVTERAYEAVDKKPT